MNELQKTLTMDGKYNLIIDVDSYQVEDRESAIDWAKAKANGVVAGIARMCIGGWFEDASFINNMLAMRREGILDRGAYIVIDPADTIQEHLNLAKDILARLEKAEIAEFGNFIKPRLILDVERYKIWKWDTKSKKWIISGSYTPKQINSVTYGVSSGMKYYDPLERFPMFYTYPSFIFEHMAGGIKYNEPDWLGEMDLWLARYGNTYEISLTLEDPGDKYMSLFKFYDPDSPFLANLCYILQFSADADSNGLGAEFGGEADDIDLNRTFLALSEIAYLFRGIIGEEPVEEPGEGEMPNVITVMNVVRGKVQQINALSDEIEELLVSFTNTGEETPPTEEETTPEVYYRTIRWTPDKNDYHNGNFYRQDYIPENGKTKLTKLNDGGIKQSETVKMIAVPDYKSVVVTVDGKDTTFNAWVFEPDGGELKKRIVLASKLEATTKKGDSIALVRHPRTNELGFIVRGDLPGRWKDIETKEYWIGENNWKA
jgi:hypothetical protein